MTRNGFKNIRSQQKSEREFHRRWDEYQRRRAERQKHEAEAKNQENSSRIRTDRWGPRKRYYQICALLPDKGAKNFTAGATRPSPKLMEVEMARKKSKDGGRHIDILRQRAGYASDRFDWKNKTGKSFREKGASGQQFPKQRPADIFK